MYPNNLFALLEQASYQSISLGAVPLGDPYASSGTSTPFKPAPLQYPIQLSYSAGGKMPSLKFHEGRGAKINAEATQILEDWLEKNRELPHPSKYQKQLLSSATHMTVKQISMWFANRRRGRREGKGRWAEERSDKRSHKETGQVCSAINQQDAQQLNAMPERHSAFVEYKLYGKQLQGHQTPPQTQSQPQQQQQPKQEGGVSPSSNTKCTIWRPFSSASPPMWRPFD